MEHDPIQNDARRARRERALGPNAACALCGVTSPESLIRVNRSLLEAHHVVTQAHDDALTLPVCRNCHALLTEAQLRHAVTFQQCPTIPERIAAILTALSAFFHTLGDTFAAWAASLTAFIGALDAHYPAWREMPGAA